MGFIKIDDITIDEFDFRYELVELEFYIIPNQHSTAKFVLNIFSEENISKRELCDSDRIICIKNKEKILFAGMIHDVRQIERAGNYDYLEISLISLSAKGDVVKKKKSFQDVSKTMKDIIEESLSSKGIVCEFKAEDKSISMPLIQYDETDWEFTRRIVSRLNSVMYPNYRSSKSEIMIGMPKSQQYHKIVTENSGMAFHSNYWKRAETGVERQRAGFIYFHVSSYENLEIGDGVEFSNFRGIVLEKEAHLIQSMILFQYKIGNQEFVNLTEYHNEAFAGRVIQGELLEVEKESVKLKFDFDETQDTQTAYAYQWTPETGNVMYLMPKKGSTINLYFKNRKEESAVAISCIRKNGETCEKDGNTNNRYLTTDYGKQMELKEDTIGFINETTNEGIQMVDGTGVVFASNNHISIVSEKALHIMAEKFVLNTPNEMILKKVKL